MINPQNYITESIRTTLLPLKVWSNRVPRGINTPSLYVLVTDMNIQETSIAKDCYEWLVGFNLDVTHVGSIGYDYQDIVNDAVEDILPKIKSLTSSVVDIKNVDLEVSRSLVYDTATNSINRQILTYSVWCNYQEG